MPKNEISAEEEIMLTSAKAFHQALLKVDTEGAIACITMVITNYCREARCNPIAVSKVIHEAIEEHIEEIREGKV